MGTVRGPCGSSCHCAGAGAACSPVAIPRTNLTFTYSGQAGRTLVYSSPAGVDQWVEACQSAGAGSSKFITLKCSAGNVHWCEPILNNTICTGTALQSNDSGGFTCSATNRTHFALDSWTASPFMIRWKFVSGGVTVFATVTP